jgi:hypothetical protein
MSHSTLSDRATRIQLNQRNGKPAADAEVSFGNYSRSRLPTTLPPPLQQRSPSYGEACQASEHFLKNNNTQQISLMQPRRLQY